MSMFCYQCQETAMGTGCTLKGVCGKTSEVANLQDLLLFVIHGQPLPQRPACTPQAKGMTTLAPLHSPLLFLRNHAGQSSHHRGFCIRQHQARVPH